MQDLFLPKTYFFQNQFVYPGPILESGYACNFWKKGQTIWKFGQKCTKF